MKILKEKVMEIVNNVNQNWVKALNEENKSLGEEKPKEVSFTDMMGKFSKEMMDLNQHFIDYEERKKGKRGLFR